ncbi:MarR family winged helix-turn-helix transcriptional regulator [Solimonas flava]|uniref:MarR family winged helix-turn-helix transcriptional regulator n=1 Tax=Solimonas flava TaxID=415849 RepID=UPI0003FF38A8|nr:MarR family transcriptional regulator [Solimonas flava]
MSAAAELHLLRFLPFRLNRLAAEVSQNLAQIYRQRYGIDVPEWRILATLGAEGRCTAQAIAASTRMHKTRVSRAVAFLRESGHVRVAAGAADGRETQLQLTPRGRRLYETLVPLALARERELLAVLEPALAAAFLEALERLESALQLPRAESAPPAGQPAGSRVAGKASGRAARSP